MRIFLDAGHRNSTYDFGATSADSKESTLALEITRLLAEGLHKAGHELFFSREAEDEVISLSSRIQKANRIRCLDWYISIHINSAENCLAEGFEVFHYGNEETLCETICANVCARTEQKNRGAKIANFAVLRDTYCKAMLIECGFINNTKERANLNTANFQKSIVNGILESLGAKTLDNHDEEDGESIEIMLNGAIRKVSVINKDDYNYIRIRDLEDHLISVSYDNIAKMPIITVKKFE